MRKREKRGKKDSRERDREKVQKQKRNHSTVIGASSLVRLISAEKLTHTHTPV